AITLAGLRVERDAELAQLFDGLPHGGAGHGEVLGQRLARLIAAVVQALEHALRQWHGGAVTHGCARTATVCARAARCRRACGARCRDASRSPAPRRPARTP